MVKLKTYDCIELTDLQHTELHPSLLALIGFICYQILKIVHFRVGYDRWIKEVKTHFLQP